MKAQEIINFRKHLKLSQEKFAHLLGVTLATVNRWEKGTSCVSPLAEKRILDLMKEASYAAN